ncbi:MAG: hypothetical protein ACUVUU_08970 [bacterium]
MIGVPQYLSGGAVAISQCGACGACGTCGLCGLCGPTPIAIAAWACTDFALCMFYVVNAADPEP